MPNEAWETSSKLYSTNTNGSLILQGEEVIVKSRFDPLDRDLDAAQARLAYCAEGKYEHQ